MLGLVEKSARALCLCLLAGCAEAERPGELMLVITSDMPLPDQIDTIWVSAFVAGRRDYHVPFDMLGALAKMPATLAFTSTAERPVEVVVQVAGSKNNRWRTFREAATLLPPDKIVGLPMPLQWLCQGMVESMPGDSPHEPDRAISSCGAGKTCRAGRCGSSAVEFTSLAEYAPSEVFGGADTPERGRCFDALRCLSDAEVAVPDRDCTLDASAAEGVNVALQVDDGGICDATGTRCLVPLDGGEREGWTLQGDRIALPPAVCEKLAAGSVLAVLRSDACPTKTPRIPVCGPWSSVTKPQPSTNER